MVSKRMEKSKTVVLYSVFCFGVFFFLIFQICWAEKSQAGGSSWGQENNEVATLQVMRKDIQSANKKCDRGCTLSHRDVLKTSVSKPVSSPGKGDLKQDLGLVFAMFVNTT